MRSIRFLRRLATCRHGAAAVEAAFALPVLLLALLGILELGRLAWVQSSLNFAVQETARCASVRPDICGTPELAASFAAAKVKATRVPREAFTFTEEACGNKISAAIEHRLILYPIFRSNPTLTAQFCRP